jgi:hypothetical protein
MALRELLHYFKLGLGIMLPLLTALLIVWGINVLVPGFAVVAIVVITLIIVTLVIGIGVEVLVGESS